MMRDLWPLEIKPAGEQAGSVRRADRGRLAQARAELAQPAAAMRLTEQDRAAIEGLLQDLAASVAQHIGARLEGDLEEDTSPLLALVRKAGLLDRDGLVTLLLARADAQRLSAAIAARLGRTAQSTVDQLVGADDDRLASAAMALAIGRGRRRDRFGQLRLELHDLAGADAQALCAALAAAVSVRFADYDPQRHARLGAAGKDQAASHDPAQGLDHATETLARTLVDLGRADDLLVERLLAEADVALLAAVLAARAGIPAEEGWCHLADGGHGRLVALLRMAMVRRETAAQLLATLEGLVGFPDAPAELARFDVMGDADIAAQRQWLCACPHYRSALLRIEERA